MKIVLIIIAGSIGVVVAGFYVLGLVSQSGQASGLVAGRLANCPDRPNCVCSEFAADVDHYIDPLDISPLVFSDAGSDTGSSQLVSRLKHIIQKMGGSIQAEDGYYLSATFTSSLFRFVDDLEIRVDRDANLVHMRSASRVGYSDRGVNRRRIESIKEALKKSS